MASKTSLLVIVATLFCAAFPAVAPAAVDSGTQATFVRTDTLTQGSWKGVYGGGGYVIPSTNSNQAPAYAVLTPQNQASWTWSTYATAVQDLQMAGTNPAAIRQASCWYSAGSNTYDLDVNVTDGNTHQIALYALDWDQRGRAETIQAVDGATGTVLDTRSVSNFGNGIFFIWNISGHVKFNVISVSGPNAVISGAFFDVATANSTPGIAHFVAADTSTQGNWHGVYGADGYTVVGDSQVAPSYAALTAMNQLSWTWAPSTSDPRSLQLGNASGRLAATWFNPSTFSVDVNIADGNSHQIALYALDWDSQGRAELIQVVDSQTGAALDSRSVFSFTKGIYLVWSVSGHVRINVTGTSGPNAVISGVFFGAGGNSNTGNNVSVPATVAAAAPISVSLTPTATTLSQTQALSFMASVQNSANQSVAWSISPNIGSISSAGVYTAPSAITSAQTVTVTATSVATPSGSATGMINLVPPPAAPPAPATPAAKGYLSMNPSSFNFGSVNIGGSASQTFAISNTGTASVTISNVSVSGAGVNATGIPTGTVLTPNQSTTLSVSFTPAAAVALAGGVTITSNASDSSAMIALTGKGTQPPPVVHSIILTWGASTSSGVVGYNVYRGTVSGGPYTLVTTSPVAITSYTDTTGQQGQTYYYVVTSIDSSNVQSGYSNVVSATIP
jgi:hypothetical protein